MYRAIPEINRICAMQDRDRRYRLHKEALKKIRQTSTPRNQSPAKSKSSLERTNSQKSLCKKVSRDESLKIAYENQKMMNTINKLEPTINRNELFEHELNHKKQVARLTQNDYSYGFVNKPSTPNKRVKAQSKLSATPSFRNIDSCSENLVVNSNLPPCQEMTKPTYYQKNSQLFHLDLSKVNREDF
ncbi:hypothetical protein TRFO_28183 [Tritrichomonas foetus]|uniref:Uncharacterized protein n=1 Tax=Tritrichomonas foetus TaxID=1144522 RepID=A0A1J4JZ99_9EUKA|nr:hypothetical protein TRFO_28183 [Tritrichomonas foetus]|eukprot:OHT04307.1 hypothetical protein TRFO_28183 [Tritrichomonas foetus]